MSILLRAIAAAMVLGLGIPAVGEAKGLLGDAAVLFDGDGHAHVVAGTLDGLVWHGTETADDRWSTRSLPGTAVFPPAVAFGESAHGVVVWSELVDGVRAGSTGDPPSRMPSLVDPAPAAPSVTVVVAGDGTAIAAWSSGGRLSAALRSRRTGAWSAPERLGQANAGLLDRPIQLVSDGAGATVFWLDTGGAPQGRLWARRWSLITRRWAPAVAVALSDSSVHEFVATGDGAGRVAVMWVGRDGPRLRERTGPLWGPIERLPSSAGHDPALAIGPSGTGVAAWNAAGRISLVRRTAGGWGVVAAPAPAAGTAACSPAVAVDRERMVLAWVSVASEAGDCPAGHAPGPSSRLLTAVGRTELGSVRWSPTTERDSDAHSPTIAASREGQVVLAWARAGWATALVATLRQTDAWSPHTELSRSGVPAAFVDVGAPTLTDSGWRVRIPNPDGGRISARLIPVGPDRSRARTVRAVASGPRRTDLQLGHLGPGTYRLFGAVARAPHSPVVIDRVFTTQFHGFEMSVDGRRVRIVVPLRAGTGVGVRLESRGRRVPMVRQSQTGVAHDRIARFTLGPVPRGRYTLRLTAVGTLGRRVQLERAVAVR